MKDNISPEEKLLKLIKGEQKSTSPNLPKQDIVIEKKTTPDIPKIKPNIKNSILSLYSFARTHLTTTAYIQKIMVGLLAVAVIYLIATFLYSWFGLSKIRLPDIASQKVEEPQFPLKKEPKPYEFYLQGIQQHQIFASSSASETASVAAMAEANSVKDINLVGIISGENPQAIIEDKKSQKTYYLNKGQSIGEFQIEDIQEGKIILNYRGQRYELYM